MRRSIYPDKNGVSLSITLHFKITHQKTYIEGWHPKDLYLGGWQLKDFYLEGWQLTELNIGVQIKYRKANFQFDLFTDTFQFDLFTVTFQYDLFPDKFSI